MLSRFLYEKSEMEKNLRNKSPMRREDMHNLSNVKQSGYTELWHYLLNCAGKIFILHVIEYKNLN